MDDDELNAAFSTFANGDRRSALYGLLDRQDVRVEGKIEPDRLEALIHDHLPLLGERGFVTYTVSQGQIAIFRGPRFDELGTLLREAQAMDEAFDG